MGISRNLAAALLALAFLASPAFTGEDPKTVISLRLSADDKVKKDVGYYLSQELQMFEGVVISDKDPDFEVEVMALDEPMGRVVLSFTAYKSFTERENAEEFRKLLARNWKEGLTDEKWAPLAKTLSHYRVRVNQQLVSGRKGKIQEICQGIAETFAKEALGWEGDKEGAKEKGVEK